MVWDTASQQWAVQMVVKEGGDQQRFGLFKSEEAAARAHDSIALELFGPAAATNFDTVHGVAVASLP